MTEAIRQQAETQRQEAEHAYQHSEYPRYGRATHLEHASALDALADTLGDIGEEPPASTGNRHADRKAWRVYWLKRKAAQKHVEAAALRAQSHDMGSSRPLGQPLQGSPARRRAQRNAIERERRVDDRAHEAHNEAEELERRAQAAASNRAVYADDPEAIDKLQAQLRTLEAKRTEMQKSRKKKTLPLLNYRLTPGETLEVPNQYHAGETYQLKQIEMTKAELKKVYHEYQGTRVPVGGAHRVRVVMGHVCGIDASLGSRRAVYLTDSKAHPRPTDEKPPENIDGAPSWAISNIAANISRIKKRIAEIEAVDEREERPARRIGDVEVVDNLDYQKVELHFPGKPDEATRTLIKSMGFRWVRTAGCWSRGINGQTEYNLTRLAEHLGAEIKNAG